MIKKVAIILASLTVVCIAVLVLLVVTGQAVINGPPPGTGDPGNKRLNELANDPVFSVIPPNASLSGPIIKKPAQFRQPAFQTAGWDGPSVRLYFVSNEPKATIYQFYAALAADAGWQTGSKDSDGNVDSWTKTYSDNAKATLTLFGPNDKSTYTLAGSTPAILH